MPGIGGPFDTAAAFFEAWANTVKFKRGKKEIESLMGRATISAEEMVKIIDDFPLQIKAMASRLSKFNNGPFPLCHEDFLHSNIMFDEKTFEVTGVIDWEGACTVPWELIAFPEFLTSMPPSFGFPDQYDDAGQPLDADERERWRERREYVEMVKAAECEDNLLSSCLSSSRCQTLAYAYGAYTCIKKLGFYDRVIKELEREG